MGTYGKGLAYLAAKAEKGEGDEETCRTYSPRSYYSHPTLSQMGRIQPLTMYILPYKGPVGHSQSILTAALTLEWRLSQRLQGVKVTLYGMRTGSKEGME